MDYREEGVNVFTFLWRKSKADDVIDLEIVCVVNANEPGGRTTHHNNIALL